MLGGMRLALLGLLFALGCNSGPQEYPTFQACFDDRGSLGVEESIVACCLEHPIAGVLPACGEAAVDCERYLGSNLASTSASQVEVGAACTEYVRQKMMM